MDDLNDLVWSTTNSKLQSNSAGQNRLSPSNHNMSNSKSGSFPFSSTLQQGGSSQKQKQEQSFGSYGQMPLNSTKNAFLSTSPKGQSSGQSLPRKPSLNKMSSDPFENLVNLGGSVKKNSTASLSLEEQRKLQLEKQKTQTLGSRCSSPADQQFWEQLSSKSPTSAPKSVPLTPSRSFSPSSGNPHFVVNKQQTVKAADPFDELLGTNLNNKTNVLPTQQQSPLVASKPLVVDSPIDDPWNLDFLEQSSSKAKNDLTSLADDDPFGLDAFTGPSSPATSIASSEKIRPQRPSKRDSNPLGILASPSFPKITVEEKEESYLSEESVEDETRSLESRSKRSPSVDPDLDHLIAQVIEMGFEPEQARAALEFSNHNVQAAIDILVENRNAEVEISRHKFKNIPSLSRRSPTSRSNFRDDEHKQPLPAWKMEKNPPDSRYRQRQEAGDSSSFDMASFQIHKEKFISNASTIGATVLSKANLFMKQASEKIRESIDDIQQRAESFQNEDDRFKRTSKPRWMRNYPGGDTSDDENPSPFASPSREKSEKELWNRSDQVQSSSLTRSHRVSPNQPVSPNNQQAQGFTPSPEPSVVPKPKRPPRAVVSATPEQLQLSEKHKTAGNDKFKLGQFGGAEELFSKAISSLPTKHDNLILLYNNRAAARIKVGDYNGAITDCDQVMELIRDDYLYPSSNDPFNFKDQLLKALTRRASANEAKERYEEAEKDFNKIIFVDPNNRAGLEGVRRCRKAIKMINGEPITKRPSITKVPEHSASADLFSLEQPAIGTGLAYSSTFGTHLDEFGFATTPLTSVSGSHISKEDLDKSEAVSRLRAQDKFAEQEEEEKLRINDMVEDRLNQWKSNKVGNLRAMIASLDSILWSELNWKPCGLQDLIQPNQVKTKYMRAIAKLHPDKLATNESVEHKLLASGIFSTLNEAWDQFKAQNGL